MEVIVSGSVTVYAPHGAYQLQVKKMEKAGLGEKYLLVEQWKKELAALGLFAADRKRELPAFPGKDRGGHIRDRRGHPRYQERGGAAVPGRDHHLADRSAG